VTSEGAFAFTPDGKQLFCTGDTAERVEFLQVYLMNVDGTNRRQISSFVDKVYRVAYSPQAGKFALSGRRSGNIEIYTMDASNMPVN
jgi:Tol biopolymer transport system component